MKKIIALFTLLIAFSCSNDDDGIVFQSNGTITGEDFRECTCCGGWFIEMENELYRFYKVPMDSKLDLANTTFPIHVGLDWKLADNTCLGDEITIDRIQKK